MACLAACQRLCVRATVALSLCESDHSPSLAAACKSIFLTGTTLLHIHAQYILLVLGLFDSLILRWMGVLPKPKKLSARSAHAVVAV